jgi:hypothetical protein
MLAAVHAPTPPYPPRIARFIIKAARSKLLAYLALGALLPESEEF